MKSVRQGSKAKLSQTLVLDFEEASVDSATLQILSPGGSELRAASGVGVAVSGGRATYTPATSWDAATYPVDRNYRAVWVFTVGADTHTRDEYFDVTLRDFESEVLDADCFAVDAGAQAKSGAAGIKSYRQEAWRDIESELSSVLRENPAIVASASQFRQPHIYRTLALFFGSERFGSLGSESESAIKYERYQAEYERTLRRALNNLNTTYDNTNEVTYEQEARPWQRVRFVK